MPNTVLRKTLTAITLKALLTLFLLPGIALALASYLRKDTDARYRPIDFAPVSANSQPQREHAQTSTATARPLTPSAACFDASPELANYRAGVCARYSPLWQFVVIERAALLNVIGNGLLLVLLVALGTLAFINQPAQYRSFVLGWHVLRVVSAVQVVMQGLFAVWLSFWLTAHFFHIYIIKLVALAGVAAAIAVFTALFAIFRKLPPDSPVQGELILPAQAPALWARLQQFAEALGTAPPTQIVAGIDANFFVTEAPLRVGSQQLLGRTLFVSIPLLRQLDSDEASAVLAHEMGHFVGGDTASSAMLGPKLTQYDDYTEQMSHAGFTLVAYYLLCLYRVIFEMALQRSSREREFAADQIAAKLSSPSAVVHALIKVAAYAQYRYFVEHDLFQQQQQHRGDLDIAQRVASGLAAFCQSKDFAAAISSADVPHPFDSHPPLQQRMRNVGHVLPEQQFADVVCRAPVTPWTNEISEVDAIEQRQWQAFEQLFAQAHDESLAYRYEPATDGEIALVLRYFPTQQFAQKKGPPIEVSYAGLGIPGHAELLDWDRIKNLKYDNALLGADRLTIEHPEKRWLGAKSTKVPVRIPRKQRDAFKQTLAHYWHRHRSMRAFKAQG